jgi:hypothetical protein
VTTGTVSDMHANCSDSTKEDREFDGVGLKRSPLPMNSVCVTVRGHECAVVKLICFVLSVDFVKEPKCVWPGLILMETALQLLAGYHRPPSAAL